MIEEYVTQYLTGYTTSIAKGICPTQAGYPVKKTRLAIVGWRHGVILQTALPSCLATLFMNPSGVGSDFRQFLGVERLPNLDREAKAGP